MNWIRLPLHLAFLLALLSFCVAASADKSAELPDGLLTVEISGLAGEQGTVYVAVYDSAKIWLGDSPVAFKRVEIAEALDQDIVVTEMVLPIGEYALSVFYDANNNGTLDTNFIGLPKEPIAMSNDAKMKFGPPKYSDAAFALQLEPVIQRINMRAP